MSSLPRCFSMTLTLTRRSCAGWRGQALQHISLVIDVRLSAPAQSLLFSSLGRWLPTPRDHELSRSYCSVFSNHTLFHFLPRPATTIFNTAISAPCPRISKARRNTGYTRAQGKSGLISPSRCVLGGPSVSIENDRISSALTFSLSVFVHA